MNNEINGEIILGMKEACADLQRHGAQGMAQSIANCLQRPVNIISQGQYWGPVVTNLVSALKNLEFTL